MALYRRSCVLIASLALAFLFVWGGTGSTRAAMGGATVRQTKLAGPYKLMLQIGPLEKMYTEAQVKKLHPMSGEVMVSGTMAMSGMGMNGMKGAAVNHHLELHVYNRTTGKTLTKVMVALTITTPAGKLIQKVPIVVMYGIKEGVNDWHYGNNVALKHGHYHVLAQVDQTKATFDLMLGGSSMSGM